MIFPLSLRILAVLASLGLLGSAGALAASPDTAAKQAIMVDFDTGVVMLEKDADMLMPPASMSKLMTSYMLFEALATGALKPDDTLPVSRKAWKKGGSKMFVKVGDRVAVEDLVRGIVVQSGNDACIVVAEGLAGSEDAFAEAMTRKAREIGMENSTFRNATGWPDPQHMMTARELALLAGRLIRDFPDQYRYFSEKSFTYAKIRQGNRNPLLYKNMGADGLKTGHTQAAGYGLTASAKRGDRRIVLVINGIESARKRSREAERLLEWGFREFANYALFKAGDTVTDADVWLGVADTVPLIIESDLTVTIRRAERKNMKVAVVFDSPLPAPIAKGTPVARLEVTAPDGSVARAPLVAGAAVEQLGMFGRLVAAAGYLVWGGARQASVGE
jgi:D-alanyl-D-alanine carboxypeptidase (penicillin-binding protein 5/6)